jgi:predicted nucleotidyltransferase
VTDTAAIIDALRSHFTRHGEGIVAAYLYGSVARGTAHSGSDVDVAVLFAHAPPPTLAGLPVDLEADLTGLVGREVQIAVLNEAPVDLVHRILRDGVLVCENDPAARIAFEVKARSEYFDLLPILQRYRRRA